MEDQLLKLRYEKHSIMLAGCTITTAGLVEPVVATDAGATVVKVALMVAS